MSSIPCLSLNLSLQWRHNERNGVLNHWLLDCLLNRLFRRRSKKKHQCSASLAFVRGINRWFPSQRANNAEMLSFDDIIMQCMDGGHLQPACWTRWPLPHTERVKTHQLFGMLVTHLWLTRNMNIKIDLVRVKISLVLLWYVINISPITVVYIMTSSNGNIFRVTGHLCGEFTDLRWIPRTKASDAELWCFLWSASE